MGRRGRAAKVPLRGAARIPATRTASPAPASGASRGAAAPTLAHPVDVGTARWPLLDCARGVAIVAMVVYHACFDLAHFGWLAADFAADWRWLAFRGAILSSFLAIAGMSLGIAAVRGLDRRRFLLRIATIAGAALLVSAGSYAMFPESYIWFGVLHAIAVMSIVTRVLLPLDAWLAPLGVAIIVAGNLVAAPVFDRPLLQWIGMMTFKPHTEDYVPLFPWLGVMLLGAAAGLFVARRRALAMRFATRRTPRAATWLPWLGKHSLVVYLAHQPLLIGVMMLVKRL